MTAKSARNRDFKQERAERTYEAILDAAAKLFPKLGYEKTQTPDLAKEAGVSTGAVYRYFEDKRQIFLEMLERELAKARAEVDARLAAIQEKGTIDSPIAVTEYVLDTIFESTKKDAALTRVFVALSLTDPDVAAIKARADELDRRAFAEMLETMLPREVVPDPAAAAMVAHVAAVGVATELALRPKKAKGPSEAEARAALRDMLIGLLFTPRAPT
ncbi:MAG: TetR/AcrR family transcriptional regulator [Deltaproteobacteria bacterium]|nr:TetR/AcrR family transcriptional regulator [Deltaproteobacteria bacterium]